MQGKRFRTHVLEWLWHVFATKKQKSFEITAFAKIPPPLAAG